MSLSLLSRSTSKDEASLKQLSIGLFGQFDEAIGLYLSSHRVMAVDDASGFSIGSVISELDGIVIRSPFKLDDASAALAHRLKWIVRAGSGADNISPLFRERGVSIRTTPNNAHAVAEFVLGLTLGLLRNIRHGHESLRLGLWEKKALVGGELRGKTVGILGYGRIGQQVSMLMHAFGTNLLAFDRSPTAPEKVRASELSGTRLVDLETVVSQADIVVLCLPGTPETKGLFNSSRLKCMKPGSFLVNVGRGALVDLDALTTALETGHLSGAALDVFAMEPPGALRLFEMRNVLCTPHLGAQTKETHRAIANGVIEHLRELCRE